MEEQINETNMKQKKTVEEKREYQRQYASRRYKENEDARRKQIERTKVYHSKNIETKKEREKQYYKEHKEEIKQKNKLIKEQAKKYLEFTKLIKNL